MISVPPPPVTDFFVSVLNERSVTVTWNAADDVIPVTGYVINYWKESGRTQLETIVIPPEVYFFYDVSRS